ncbi:sulfotransferase family protein [Sulfitobacter sp. 1A12057]|uniref:sulfotransferase family protein n=1 Tax=Sulfitobacter sp. 1A12057 TaxID=3368567 RepID=UPI00374681BF
MALDGRDRQVGFIISHQRSGSTYLRTCLNRLDDVVAPSESHFLLDYYRHGSLQTDTAALQAMIQSHRRLIHWRMDRLADYCEALDVPDFFFDLLADQDPEHAPRVVLDKTPEYLDIIHTLARDFPDAKFILLIRNGIDVVLSLESRGWQGPFQENRMQYWNAGCRAMVSLAHRLGPDRCLTLRYEDVMGSPKDVASSLSDFLGIAVRTADLVPKPEVAADFTETERVLGIHKALAAGRKLDRRRQNLLSPADRDYMTACMGEMLYAFGYIEEPRARTLAQRLRFASLRMLGNLARYIPERPARVLAQIRRKYVPKRADID